MDSCVGTNQYGLFKKCEELLYENQRTQLCKSHRSESNEWIMTAVFIVFGLIFLFMGIICSAMAIFRAKYMVYARWHAFVAGQTAHAQETKE